MKQEEFDREIWTTQNVAEYYGCTPQAVYDMRNSGKLHQLVNLPGVRFSKTEVLELAKMPGDSLLPHEVARLKRELKLEKEKNERLMCLMFKVSKLGSQAMAEILKGDENNELES